MSAYNAEGRETASVDQLGNSNRWSYDGFGQMQSSTDIGGATTTYGYDLGNNLVLQTSTRGQHLAFTYDQSGQLLTETDTGTPGQTEVTQYNYDLAGHHTLESTSITVGSQTTVYQSQMIQYDALGRVTKVVDNANFTELDTSYDAMGNTTHIRATALVGNATLQDLWFSYDKMNQEVEADGRYVANSGDTNALTSTQGHFLTYDLDGNRISDTSMGRVVTKNVTASVTVDESGDENNGAVSTTYDTTYAFDPGASTYFYHYDAMDRLSTVSVGGYGSVLTSYNTVPVAYDENGNVTQSVQVPVYELGELGESDATLLDTRKYDAAGRELESGPEGALPADYVTALVGNNVDLSGATTTVSRYDQLGHLLQQNTVNEADHSKDNQVTYQNYDAAGNLTDYRTQAGSTSTTYHVAIAALNGYKEASTTVTSGGNHVTTTDTYDANGYLVKLKNDGSNTDERDLVNDAHGEALQKTESGKTLKEMIVAGEVVGTYGMVAGSSTQQVDFDLAFTPVTNSYPNAATGQYPVQSGDTLESIALSAYGDSSLWYLIADANGLSSDSDLRVGQIVNIPTKVNGAHNNASNVTPYDASKIVGSTTPSLPAPQPKHGCGIIGTIIMVIVAAVVTYFTLGAAAPYLAAAFTAAGASVAVAGAAAFVVDAALTGALASIASQAVGDAIGQTKGFSWKQVGMSALTEVVTAGLGGGGTGQGVSGFATSVAAGAVANATTQELGVQLGLQKNFSWRQVAGAAAGAGVGNLVSDLVQPSAGASNPAQSQPGYSPTAQDYVGTAGTRLAGYAAVGLENLAASATTMEIDDRGHAKFKDIFAQAAGNTLATVGEGEVKAYQVQRTYDEDSSHYETPAQHADDWAHGRLPAGVFQTADYSGLNYGKLASSAGNLLANTFGSGVNAATDPAEFAQLDFVAPAPGGSTTASPNPVQAPSVGNTAGSNDPLGDFISLNQGSWDSASTQADRESNRFAMGSSLDSRASLIADAGVPVGSTVGSTPPSVDTSNYLELPPQRVEIVGHRMNAAEMAAYDAEQALDAQFQQIIDETKQQQDSASASHDGLGYVLSHFGGLLRQTANGLEHAAVGVFKLATSPQAQINFVQTTGGALVHPIDTASSVYSNVKSFAALPVGEQGDAAFKFVTGTAVTLGVGKVISVAGDLAYAGSVRAIDAVGSLVESTTASGVENAAGQSAAEVGSSRAVATSADGRPQIHAFEEADRDSVTQMRASRVDDDVPEAQVSAITGEPATGSVTAVRVGDGALSPADGTLGVQPGMPSTVMRDFSPQAEGSLYQQPIEPESLRMQSNAAPPPEAPPMPPSPPAAPTGPIQFERARPVDETPRVQAPATAMDETMARRNTAQQYYEQLGWPQERIDSHLGGIDFSQHVEVQSLAKGQQVVQYQIPGNPVGRYFAPVGTPAESIGVDPVGRIASLFETTEDVSVLKSSAADTSNNLSLPELARGKGGGTQYFAADNSPFKMVEPSAQPPEPIVNVEIATAGKGSFVPLQPESSLTAGQAGIHAQLPEPGSFNVFQGEKISMEDLRAIGQVTGDEYNLFHKEGQSLVIRGNGSSIEVSPEMHGDLLDGVYGRFEAHTHPPGYSIDPGPPDRPFLAKMGQEYSQIWGDDGVYTFGQHGIADDLRIQSELNSKMWQALYGD